MSAAVEPDTEQGTIKVAVLRAGTSKGLFFHEADLPAVGPERDRLLLRLMGSPDVLQIDGLGGSRPITSKVAIVARSARDDADVDYTFAQVEIERELVIYEGNCGNISSGVGPFAIDERLVEAVDGITMVRIYNTNTRKIMIAHVSVANGRARVEGSFAIPGVPGTGAEIVMNWSATVGSKSGRLLPTTNARDAIALDDGRTIDVTICDAGNLCIWARAADFGISGSELSDAMNANAPLLDAVREVRGKVGILLGLGKDWRRIDERVPGLMLGLISPPASYVTLSGTTASEGDMDLRARLIFMNRLHESIAGTGSISLAAASRVPGSVVQRLSANGAAHVLRIGHPSGITPALVEACATETPPFVDFRMLGFSRTSRRLMDAVAYYPRSVLEPVRS